MQSITVQLFADTFCPPAAIQSQVSGDGFLCFGRSGAGGREGGDLGKVEKRPYQGMSPSYENDERGEHRLQRVLGLHSQADTQTDAGAFVPNGTTSARHKEQPSHAVNRPTK